MSFFFGKEFRPIMRTNSVRICAEILVQNLVRIVCPFWLALDAPKFSKGLCGNLATKFGKDLVSIFD